MRIFVAIVVGVSVIAAGVQVPVGIVPECQDKRAAKNAGPWKNPGCVVTLGDWTAVGQHLVVT